MDKNSRDNRFIRKPIYPGGNKAYRAFINSNLKYPKQALANKTEGMVLVKYEINQNGDVQNPKVISKIGHGCDEEAVRIVKLLKFEIPKGPRKLRVIFNKTVRINFKLPKAKPKTKTTPRKPSTQGQTTYAITYTAKKTEKKDAPKESSKSYNYNITWS